MTETTNGKDELEEADAVKLLWEASCRLADTMECLEHGLLRPAIALSRDAMCKLADAHTRLCALQVTQLGNGKVPSTPDGEQQRSADDG